MSNERDHVQREREEHPSGLHIIASCPECDGPIWLPQGETCARCLCCDRRFVLDTGDEDAAA